MNDLRTRALVPQALLLGPHALIAGREIGAVREPQFDETALQATAGTMVPRPPDFSAPHVPAVD